MGEEPTLDSRFRRKGARRQSFLLEGVGTGGKEKYR